MTSEDVMERYDAEMYIGMKRQKQSSREIQLEKMNQKILAKEHKLKRYRHILSNNHKTGHFKIRKENYIIKLAENARRLANK